MLLFLLGGNMGTLKEMFLDLLGDPPMYRGYPVDLSSLDTEVKGYVIPGPRTGMAKPKDSG